MCRVWILATRLTSSLVTFACSRSVRSLRLDSGRIFHLRRHLYSCSAPCCYMSHRQHLEDKQAETTVDRLPNTVRVRDTSWFLTGGVAATRRAAQPRPLQVEAVLAALTAAALGVPLTVNAVEAPRVPQAVSRSPIALATHRGCRRQHNIFVFCLIVVFMSGISGPAPVRRSSLCVTDEKRL